MRTGLQRVLTAILLIWFTGCVDRATSPYQGLSPAQARQLATTLATQRDERLQADLRSAFTVRSPRNILILSGGDAHGAFGCGVLNGWKNAAEPRPQFDIVTGVSTGALMATFAFLGEPKDDQLLRDVYLHAKDSDIFDGPIGGPPDAVLDTAPLRQLIARVVTVDTLRRVAAAHHQGRRLYAATVELDTGALFIWPMSQMADRAVSSSGDVDLGLLEKFRAILLASASIPVLFPPVEIDGGLHVDAGLRAALFVHEAMLGVLNAPGHIPATRSPGAPPTVWVIFNGEMSTTPQSVSADLLHIGGRSLEIYTHAVELLSLREAAYVTLTHQPTFRFRWISEPAGEDPDPPAPGLLEPMFDPKATEHRYQVGQTLGESPVSWNEGPPPIEDDATTKPSR